MRTRSTSIFLLVWLVPFFAVVAPGHQRGAIQLPGSDELTISAMSCALCDSFASDSNRPTSPTDPAGNCALCQFNGTLLNPPPFFLPDLRVQRLDLPPDQPAIALAPVPAPLPRLSGRAPPTHL